jgi:hypothetical protein
VLGELADLAGDLDREFPRGHEHEGREGILDLDEAVDQRKAERRGLAGAGLGLPEDVAAAKRDRDQLGLDAGGMDELHLANGLGEGLGETELGEGLVAIEDVVAISRVEGWIDGRFGRRIGRGVGRYVWCCGHRVGVRRPRPRPKGPCRVGHVGPKMLGIAVMAFRPGWIGSVVDRGGRHPRWRRDLPVVSGSRIARGLAAECDVGAMPVGADAGPGNVRAARSGRPAIGTPRRACQVTCGPSLRGRLSGRAPRLRIEWAGGSDSIE